METWQDFYFIPVSKIENGYSIKRNEIPTNTYSFFKELAHKPIGDTLYFYKGYLYDKITLLVNNKLQLLSFKYDNYHCLIKENKNKLFLNVVNAIDYNIDGILKSLSDTCDFAIFNSKNEIAEIKTVIPTVFESLTNLQKEINADQNTWNEKFIKQSESIHQVDTKYNNRLNKQNEQILKSIEQIRLDIAQNLVRKSDLSIFSLFENVGASKFLIILFIFSIVESFFIEPFLTPLAHQLFNTAIPLEFLQENKTK